MAAPFAERLDNKMTFRRLGQEGKVCSGIAELERTCDDPAKYLVTVHHEGNVTNWELCSDHARDILYYQIGHL